MASPHPGLRIVALFVVGLAIGASLSNPVTASGPPADHPGRATIASELPTRLPLKVDSINPAEGNGIRPVQTGSAAPKPDAAVPVFSFEGLHFGTNGPYTNRLTPPDVQVAVGPNHVIEMVNVLGRVSTKQGVEVQTFPLSTFFGVPSTDFISDPKVHFDTASGRWFASIADVTTGSVLLEVSATDDPTGSWNSYRVSTITGCADQPLLGFSDLVVIVSANDFSSCTSGNPSYLGVQYWVLNKTDLLSGAVARSMSFGPDPTLFSVHPVQSLLSTDTEFMVSTGSGPTSTLTLFSVTGVPPGLVLATAQKLGIRSTTVPPSAPQLGSRSTLDTADNRVQDAMWADERLWLSLADGCIPVGDNRLRSCVRLIELDTANGTIAQDFDVGISGKYLFYPALRTDAAGNLVVVFGYSSATEYPETRVATRSVHDPPNTIGAAQVIRAGEGPEASGCPNNSVCRYGDYFGASQDPSDPGVVWVAGEYGTANGWATFIAAMAETVQLTVAYVVQGGGSTYLAPAFTYVRGGQSVTVALTTAPADFTVDAGTAWSVSPVLGGSGANERWATNESVSGRDEVRIPHVSVLPPVLRVVRVPRHRRHRVRGAFRKLRAIRTRSIGPRESDGLGGCGQRLLVPVVPRRLERERALAGRRAESERDRRRVGGHRGRIPSSSLPDVRLPGSRRVVDYSRFRLVRCRCLPHAYRHPGRRLGRGHLDRDRTRRVLRTPSESDDSRRRADVRDRDPVSGSHDHRGRRRVCLVLLRRHLRDRGWRFDPHALRSDRDHRDGRGESILLVHVRAMEWRDIEQSVDRQRDRDRSRPGNRPLLTLGKRGAGVLFLDRRGWDYQDRKST